MARKTKLVTIQESGRDQGKGFLLTEMPALKAEKWASRALLAITSSGVEVPEDFDPRTASAAQLATVGLGALGRAKWELVEPLLEEMMGCVQYVPKPSNPTVILSLSANEDAIEEVRTLLTLRKELLELHLGFSLADRFKNSSLPVEEQSTTI